MNTKHSLHELYMKIEKTAISKVIQDFVIAYELCRWVAATKALSSYYEHHYAAAGINFRHVFQDRICATTKTSSQLTHVLVIRHFMNVNINWVFTYLFS